MSGVTVKILGCGDAFGSGGRFHTCFLVKSSQLNFLIDCGGTSIHALKKENISTNDIDAIVISHFHGDHFGGIPFFLLDACFVERRTKPLTIITPKGGFSRIKTLTELLYPGSPEIMDNLKLVFLEYNAADSLKFSGLIIDSFEAIHSQESLPHSLKIKVDDKIIGFSGDTEWNDNLPKVSEKADLFICESCWFDKPGKGHLNYYELRDKKELLKSKQIVLTHMAGSTLEHTSEMSNEFICGYDGLEIAL